MLRFAEEIMLLLLEDEGKRFLNVPDASLRYALAGGVLMDLAMEDRIDTDLDRLILVDPTPLDDDLLDPVLADIAAATAPHDARYWVEQAASGAYRTRETSHGTAGRAGNPGAPRGPVPLDVPFTALSRW